MKPEKAIFRPDPATLSPGKLAGFFAEMFVLLDERPVPANLDIELPEANVYSIDLDCGSVVFSGGGGGPARLDLRGRYLAEHEIPLALGRKTRLSLVPTSGNRVKVRRRLFPL